MNSTLVRILDRYDGNKEAAMRYLIRVSLQFPQLKEEYEEYISALKAMGE